MSKWVRPWGGGEVKSDVVNDIAWLDDRRVVCASENGEVGLVIMPTYANVTVRNGPNNLASMAVTPDGEVILLDADGVLSTLSLPTLEVRSNDTVSDKVIARYLTTMELSSGGNTVAVAYDTKVQIASTANGRTLGWLDHYDEDTDGDQRVNALAFSPDGSLLATASADSRLRLWELPACELVATFTGHRRTVTAVAFSPDGKLLASGGGDTDILLWDVPSRKKVDRFSGHTGGIRDIRFSPAGDVLATGGEHSVRLWDVAEGRQRHSISDVGAANALAFSRDGSTLAVASIGQVPVTLCHVDTGRIVGRLLSDGGSENPDFDHGHDVAFTSDDQLRAIVYYHRTRMNLVTLAPE